MNNELDRALATLGPLEGRIMRAAWTGAVPVPFVVRDMQAVTPELAYTTVMTTMRRLAERGLLESTAIAGQKAHEYRATGTPADFLVTQSALEARRVEEQYGEAALAAFAARLASLPSDQLKRLQNL